MIIIDRAFYSRDKSTIDVILRTGDEINYPLASISALSISKEDGNINSTYAYNKEITSVDAYAVVSININNDLQPLNELTLDFNTHGITTVTIEYLDGSSSFSFYDSTEFYTHKTKLLNINCDISNIQKISKKINTYVFLEQLLITALDNSYIEDAKKYYSEILKLYTFGYSDVVQNNPNTQY